MNSHRQKPPAPWPYLFLFLIVSVIIVVMGSLYIKYQKKALLLEKQNELSAISDLKIKQITHWRHERLGDGGFIMDNILMVSKFTELLNNPDDKTLFNNVLKTLKSLTDNFDYKNALLLDEDGNVRVKYPNQDTLIGEHLKPLLTEIIKQRKVVLTDLHRASSVSFVHLDLIIPVIDSIQNDVLVKGFLALRIDPKKILYPLIQSWPTTSKSAESLIIRKEGNDIIYLNELRHLYNTELSLTRPVGSEMLPEAMAVQGLDGTINGLDYRNVPVVAAMRKIPGTQWYMVSKIDKDEVFSVLSESFRMVTIIIFLIILSIGLFLVSLWWNTRVRFFREKYEAELNHLALVKHFDYILKFANDIILLIDSNLIIIEANDRALETYMYTRDEFIGMSLVRIRAPESLPELQNQLNNVIENESATFETIHKRKDGTIFPVEISSRIVNIEGSIYYQTIGRDITDRKSAEEILKESEEKFRKIFEESPFSMAMTGKDFGIIKANTSFCKLIGYKEEDLTSLTFRDFTHPDYIKENVLSLMKLVAGEIPVYHTEKRYITKDNSVIWGETTISRIHNLNGEIQFFLVMINDITQRKVAEAALEESFSLLRATLESTADGLLVVDSSGRIVQYNKKFTEMWRIPSEILATGVDNNALDYVRNQLVNPDRFLENVKQIYTDPEVATSDLLEFKDGRIFERYSQPQKINFQSVGRVWSFRDITEMKVAEEKLLFAKEKAEESDRMKTAFLHNVSHEIRTPMNAIIGFSTMLNEPDLQDEERNQYIEIIFQSSNQLLSIINDIVDIANIETGQVRLNLGEINLNATLRTLNEQFNIKEQGLIKLPVYLCTGLPDEQSNVLTDSTKFVQILSNLISNSKKFTNKGQIDFGYSIKGDFLEFYVKDTGIGIPPEHREKIFDRFYQVDRAVSRQYGGTGLGLSICKAYVELLGGTISVESEDGKGTLFVFTIPFVTPG